MPDQPTQEQIEKIANVLTSGRKIDAIKICREITGKGLKDSKDFVEALVPKLIEQDPEKYKALSQPQGAGCASALVACVGLGAVATLLVKAIA